MCASKSFKMLFGCKRLESLSFESESNVLEVRDVNGAHKSTIILSERQVLSSFNFLTLVVEELGGSSLELK